MNRRWIGLALVVVVLGLAVSSCTWFGQRALDSMGGDPFVDVEIVVDGELTAAVLAELEGYGRIGQVLYEAGGLSLKLRQSAIPTLTELSYVAEVGYPALREVHDDYTATGRSTWDLDMMNVTEFGGPGLPAIRAVPETGDGVYVAVLDTGLVFNWRDYFPEDRIDTELAIAFAGGGNDIGQVSTPANKWEHDTHSHGTHVTSTILGYSIYGAYNLNGVAPKATVIPVKVLGNNGSGWSTMVAAGIEYIGELKAGPLANFPVVINMSLGGPELSPLEKDAIDYAIAQGVIVVASAGNEGEDGMGYPGAYEPVISVGACGWIYEWAVFPITWWQWDVSDPTNPDEVYITDFSSRELPGQDLDVVAPGSWIVGPYLAYGAAHPPWWAMGVPGQYYYLGGTSMAAPHVAGTAALMLEKNPGLSQAEVDFILTTTALPLPAWTAAEAGSGLVLADQALAGTP